MRLYSSAIDEAISVNANGVEVEKASVREDIELRRTELGAGHITTLRLTFEQSMERAARRVKWEMIFNVRLTKPSGRGNASSPRP